MIEDCESLQKRLAEAESSLEELTSELAARQRLSASCAVDALTRKYKALQVEEISLKDELCQSHAEESRLCQEIANIRTSLMAEEARSMLTELARMDIKAELVATSQCLADERMRNKDAMDRLRLELMEARAANDDLQRALQRSREEKGSVGGHTGVRAPMVPPDTPIVQGALRGAFRVSEHARDQSEVMEMSTPSTTTGGPDQLRGTEHVHDRSIKVQERAVGQGIMLSPIRDPVVAAGSIAGGSESQGLTALAQTIIGGKPVFLRGAKFTPTEVKTFVSQKRTQLRSGVFVLSQLYGDIDENAMLMIELKIACSRALKNRPGPWRETWDVEYFLKALEEIYAVSEVD